MSSFMSRSTVLDNDDLLGDILLRVDSPTTLVRAALVSKRWYRGASYPTFLRRFRGLNPPRLLGIYISGEGVPRPEFVQVPTRQPSEHTATANGANFGFDDFAEFSSTVWDCRNGRVLYEFAEAFHLARAPAVRTLLRYPGQDVAVLPLAPANLPECPHAMLLPDDGDNATCYRVDVGLWNEVVAAKVYVLRSGEWSVHCSAAERLARTPEKILMNTLLAGGKIYMMTMAGYILGLDLSTARFFIIDLPDGVAFEYDSNLVPSRGDDSALYLVHVKGDKLSVWLRRADNHAGASEWVLKDTISLKETCADFFEQEQGPEQADGDGPVEVGVGSEPEDGDAPAEVGSEPEDGDAPAEVGSEPEDGDAPNEVAPEPAADGGGAPIDVIGVGDDAEFVFLELGDSGVIVYLHLGSKKVEKVYQRDPDDDNVIRVHPFLMVWPPSFPALRKDEAEEGHQE